MRAATPNRNASKNLRKLPKRRARNCPVLSQSGRSIIQETRIGEAQQSLTVKQIGALVLQVLTLYGAACAQSRELSEASHALYRGENARASDIAREYLKLHPGS